MAEQIRNLDPGTPRYGAEEFSLAAQVEAPGVHGGVAATLKEARERHDRSLRDVAAVLNIRYVYLQAIEDGEFKKLPGNAYAIGFVRAYAEYLGLDSDDLVARFKTEVAELGKQTELVFPTPVPEGKVPGGALILVSLLFFGLAFGAWSYFSKEDGQVADLVPTVPQHLQGLLAEDQAETSAVETSLAPAQPLSDYEAESAAIASPELPVSETVAGVVADPVAPEEAPVAPEEPAEAETGVLPSETEAAEASFVAAAPFETAPIGSNGAAPDSSPAEPETTGVAVASETPARPEVQPEETAALSEPSVDTPVAAASQDAETVPQASDSPAPEAPYQTIATAPEPQPIPAAPSTGDTAAVSGPLEAQVYGRGNVGTRIVLRATQDSWVQVRDHNEDLLFTRVLRAGDSYQVPNQSGLTLLTGNAGGLEVEVDGTTLGTLGPVGTVRRDVTLEPAQLLDGSTLTQ
jgi:cytoskeletal protein RodZ